MNPELVRTFVCPRCGATSHNPHDRAYGYCGRCHWWTGDAQLGQVEPPQSDEDVA